METVRHSLGSQPGRQKDLTGTDTSIIPHIIATSAMDALGWVAAAAVFRPDKRQPQPPIQSPSLLLRHDSHQRILTARLGLSPR